MENSNPKNQNGWVPKQYYLLPDNIPETLQLPLPDTEGNKSYALALQDKNGKPSQQPSYSRPFTCDSKNPQNPWSPVENGRFDGNANAASIAAGSKKGAKEEDSKTTSSTSKKTTNKKKSKNSATGAISSVAVVSAIVLSMFM